ncbi:MAG: alpha/beta hydrolase [Elusimicrobia bacterium]|nr:alpha/beta hydrolase [Elusimicrobiota bacterium]
MPLPSRSSAAWVCAVVLGLVLLRAGIRSFERMNVYIPSRGFTIMPQTYGMDYRDVSLKTSDGVPVHGWYVPAAPARPEAKSKPAAGPLAASKLVLLYCHGNAGNISTRVPKVNMFHRLGLGVLLFDYRGYGRSEGSPSEAGTYLDAEAAYRWLVEEAKVPAQNILVYGESLGNAVAIETALHHPSRALILESPFTSILDMGRLIFPFLPVSWLVTIRYDNLAKIPDVRSPVLVLHSKDDRIIPVGMGRRVYEAARDPKEFVELVGSHDEAYLESGDLYPKALVRFLGQGAAS